MRPDVGSPVGVAVAVAEGAVGVAVRVGVTAGTVETRVAVNVALGDGVSVAITVACPAGLAVTDGVALSEHDLGERIAIALRAGLLCSAIKSTASIPLLT
jgi:hypothetical protein